ncbi:DHH family phosphoesterase [Vibrio gallicus]|uniref:DHH family phosphoesterase n=1 Tax=Vibrio gallicus TaxID=190897 RepID=UPI0021C4066F|nr:DHH family phosphoesterase [Vibrio gallicus]
MHYDVFNGDADGICSLLQLRLVKPQIGTLVTGIKRDIQLLKQVPTSATSVTALDISLEKNLADTRRLLEHNCTIFYCDHHRAPIIPSDTNLTALINTEPTTCTSLLINQHLNSEQVIWAIVGAFGDNLMTQGNELAAQQGFSPQQTQFLKQLGTLINYNGYGATLDDLHYHPAELYHALYNAQNPFQLQADNDSAFYALEHGFNQDRDQAKAVAPYHDTPNVEVYTLPNAPWARRISGTFANQKANQNPAKAIAILSHNPDNQTYTVSVRSPLNNRTGADEVCIQFATGGGRKAAAGINALPKQILPEFITAMEEQF